MSRWFDIQSFFIGLASMAAFWILLTYVVRSATEQATGLRKRRRHWFRRRKKAIVDKPKPYFTAEPRFK